MTCCFTLKQPHWHIMNVLFSISEVLACMDFCINIERGSKINDRHAKNKTSTKWKWISNQDKIMRSEIENRSAVINGHGLKIRGEGMVHFSKKIWIGVQDVKGSCTFFWFCDTKSFDHFPWFCLIPPLTFCVCLSSLQKHVFNEPCWT